MAKKFILIDQSISSIAGHHYEYAAHVLEAAQRAGYEPYLATHKRFAASSHGSPWKTFPIYRFGFWASQGAPAFGSLSWLLGQLGWLRFRWRLAYNYSLFGLLWAVRNRFGEFLLKQPISRPHVASLITVIPAAIGLKLLRLIGLLLLLPFTLLIFLFRSVVRLLKAGGFPESYARSLFADAADLSSFTKEIFRRRNQILGWWQQYRCIRGFQSDTARILRDAAPGKDDIIFIPTLSAIELMGLSELLRSGSHPTVASWHLLFRRDIYRGREVDYAPQDSGLNDLRNVFMTAAAKMKGFDVRFYTDTDELTDQYNRLGIFAFHTVPIPHTHRPLAKVQSTIRPLRVIYIGDARREKGYHAIPGLVEDLWSDYVETGRITFHLQSNFNVPQGEPEAVIAREHLELLARRKPGAIELIKQPLTSEQYRDFVLSGDINLLMYDATNYYARSSGILVESLSAGMPVVVPAASWLARQFREPVYHWQEAQRDQMRVLQAMDLESIRWRIHGNAKQNPVSNGELTASYGGKAFAWLHVAPGTTHLLLRLMLQNGSGEAFLYMEAFDAKDNSIQTTPPRLLEPNSGGEVVEFLPVPPQAARIWFAIGSTRPSLTVRATALAVDFLAPLPGHPRPPLSVIGAIYQDMSEVPGLMRELIDQHPHYSSSAREFARSWHSYHNADALITALEQPAGARA